MRLRLGVGEALAEAGPGTLPVLVAPTGYGKTSSVHMAWAELSSRWGRVVHVLPLRALVAKTAEDAVTRGVPLGDVAYQAMIERVEVEEGGVAKSPYMFSKYVVTTYDSFLLSLYVCPVAELWRVYAHRDTGVLAACGGGVLLDEVHLVLAIDQVDDARSEASKAYTCLLYTAKVLTAYLERPVVAATATLPRSSIRGLYAELSERDVEVKLHLCLGRRGLRYYSGCAPSVEHGLDPDYASLYDCYKATVRTSSVSYTHLTLPTTERV